ncbi:MAG: hypothetical protein RL481_2479 [Pseudomonadota bacterium]|jgi:hypothetical protein
MLSLRGFFVFSEEFTFQPKIPGLAFDGDKAISAVVVQYSGTLCEEG